jgi:pimeloyl-ACP methyl ester carboxylesterase
MSLVNTSTSHCLSEAVSEDGVSIAYQDLGYGEPLVLLHGVTESRESWHEASYVEQFLQSERRLILVDCRGHGRSGKPFLTPALNWPGPRVPYKIIFQIYRYLTQLTGRYSS